MQENYIVGIYARLSRDDERAGESVSIENQKEICSWLPSASMPVPDVTVNTRRGVYVSYEPAQNGQ